MDIQPSPFLSLDKQTIIGALKATGTRDPDVLHAQKSKLRTAAKFPKLAGTYLMVVGGLLSLTIIGAFIGLPILALGWWCRRRGVRNLAALEAAYSEYTGGAFAAPELDLRAQPRSA